MSTDHPLFPVTLRHEVRNVRTGEPYFLQRADAIVPSSTNIADLVRICNEPAIYSFLFGEALDGAPYGEQMARDFFDWSAQGWRGGTYFVFVVTTADDRLAAAIDLKSADLAAAEIGFWCSIDHRGLMGATVGALCSVAAAAGFRSLFARVRHANTRSQDVVLRNGFARDPTDDTTTHLMFRRNLAASEAAAE